MKQIDKHDREIIRDLAKRVVEIAADPVMSERRKLWTAHNSLRPVRPMLLIFPEGSWLELLPDDALLCEEPFARAIEARLKRTIYTNDHFHDDTVVEPEWVESAVISSTGWGLEPHLHDRTEARGSFAFEPVLNDSDDLKKMRFPELVYDEPATTRNIEIMQDLLGDILPVKLVGRVHISYHLTSQLIYLRGVTEMMMDMIDRPEFVHEVMAFFEEGHRKELQQLIDMNLLSLNNNGTYQSSGGNGYTDELPAEGFNPDRVRPCDMWASAEAQELAGVSPDMHCEFAMQYENRLLEPFGLSGYGCCEDLTHKLDYVKQIPHIRRISCSPWANVDRCAEKLKEEYIFSWKPNPAHLVGTFDPVDVRNYIRHTINVCKENNCVLEIILKDTHTVEQHPERFDEWTRIAREEIDATA